jgi:prolyl-tRNA synthetase
MFIPESYLKKEADHVKGFAPEVAVVTYAGGAELAEKLVIRPTSETIICDMYSKWIKSYRDLPMKMNQWCNVVRWEKTTRPFLRTSEFLWQEGHTVYDSAKGAEEDSLRMLEVYRKFGEDLLAIPFFTGKKTEGEKFPGAVNTYTIEAMMHDGKSLQSGTSHDLGQNFAKAFGIKFLNKNEELEYGYSSSWGVSTRLLGAIIMVHGDNRGLVLPPRIAPIQVVIIPIGKGNQEVLNKAKEIEKRLSYKGIRVFVDDTENSPGWKFNQWEMKGVPIRIELGARDLEKGEVIFTRRDTLEKENIALKLITAENISARLDKIHKDMYEKAKKYRDERIVDVSDMNGLEKALDDKKFARVNWCGCQECFDKVKTQTGATPRVIENESYNGNEKCFCGCGKRATKIILVARSY